MALFCLNQNIRWGHQTPAVFVMSPTTGNREVTLCRCSAETGTAAKSSPRGSGSRQSRKAGKSHSSLAIPHPSENSHRDREEILEEAMSCLQKAADAPCLLANDHCSVCSRDFPTAVLHFWALLTLITIQSSHWSNSIFPSDCTGFWMWLITASSAGCSQILGLCFAGNGNRWSQLFFLTAKSIQYLLLIFLPSP